VVIQARQDETWRNLLGVSSALNVALRRQGDSLQVEIGAGKWVDKAAAAGAGVVLPSPFLFPASSGALHPSKLSQRSLVVTLCILATRGATAAETARWVAGRYTEAQRYVSAVQSTTAPASSGGEAAPGGAYRFCPQCGAELPAGARFCPACGAKIGG